MDYLFRQKDQYTRISRENRRFSDLRLDLAKRGQGKQRLRIDTEITCEPRFTFNAAYHLNPKPNLVIWDLRILVDRYQPWLDLVFDETITAQEFIFEFASVETDLDINEALFSFLYERYPYAIDYQLDQVQLLIETIIEDYYESQRRAMVFYGFPDYFDFILIKFIDPHSAVFKISVT